MSQKVFFSLVLIPLFVIITVYSAFCQEPSIEGITTDQAKAIIELLQKKGIISEEEAIEFIDRTLSKQVAADKKPPSTMEDDQQRHADINQLRRDVKRDSSALLERTLLLERRLNDVETKRIDPLTSKAVKSDWAEKIKLSGDMRIRYQGDYMSEDNGLFLEPGNLDELMNTTEDRERYRYRARIGLRAKLIDPRDINVGKMEAGFRIATGNDDDPVSTNDTLGDYYNKDGIVLDRGYLRYTYSPDDTVWGGIPQLSVVAGRFENPWFSTDLVWDSDVNFEGVAVTYETDTAVMRSLNGFLTAGYFPLQEEEFSGRDKWLWGAQLGLEYQPGIQWAFKAGLAYYDYHNLEGIQNPVGLSVYDFTAPQYQQKGNLLIDIDPDAENIKTALGSDYDILDLYLKTDIKVFLPVHIILEGQYVINLAFDVDELAKFEGYENIPDDKTGYMAAISIGYPTIYNFGEWNIGLKYKYLGADAVLDAFADSDFHLGGTNAQGWIFTLNYGVYRNVWLTTRWLTANQIEGPQFTVDTLQIDLNARF